MLEKLKATGFKKYADVRILGWGQHKKIARTEYGEKVKSYYLDESPSLNIKAALDDVADAYQISADPKDYELVVVRAVEADIPNDNGDAFPMEELLRFDEKIGSKIYRTFNLKPHHVNHQSQDPKMARGVILDSNYNQKNDGKSFVEILVACDKTKDPILVRNIISGKLNKFSMGCHCDYTVCSICEHKAFNEMQFCEHIANNKMGKIAGKLAFEKCYGVVYDEISSVYDPAMKGCEAIDVLKAEKETNIKAQTEELLMRAANKKKGKIVISGLREDQTITITNNLGEEVSEIMTRRKKAMLEPPTWVKSPTVWHECVQKLEADGGQASYPAAVKYYQNKCKKMGVEAGEEEENMDLSQDELMTDVEDEFTEETVIAPPPEDMDIVPAPGEEPTPPEEEVTADDEVVVDKVEVLPEEEEAPVEELLDEEVPKDVPEEILEEEVTADVPEDVMVPEEEEMPLEEEEILEDLAEEKDEEDDELSEVEFGMKNSGLLNLDAERIDKRSWVISDKKGPLYLVRLRKAFPKEHKSWSDRFASRSYGVDLMKAILKEGFIKTMKRVNAINVVSDLPVPKGVNTRIWLETVGEASSSDRNKIMAAYKGKIAKIAKMRNTLIVKKVKKADPATVETKDTKVDFADPKPIAITDDIQPLIPPAKVKSDTESAKDLMPPTDTHHLTAYKDIAAEFGENQWKILNGEKCLFSINAMNSTRKVGEKILQRVAKLGLFDTWEKFGEDLPSGITEDQLTDLDEKAKSNYKAKDDVPKIVGPAELASDSKKSLDELPETEGSVVKVEELKRQALKEATLALEAAKQEYRIKLRRAIVLATKRANFNIEENALKAALWDVLAVKADLDHDLVESAIETSFDQAGQEYVTRLVDRGEELAEYSTAAFAQLEEDMRKIKPVAVAEEDDDKEEKEEEEEEKEASKIAKQAESGSLGLKRSAKEVKGGTKIGNAVMRYNVAK